MEDINRIMEKSIYKNMNVLQDKFVPICPKIKLFIYPKINIYQIGLDFEQYKKEITSHTLNNTKINN